MEEHLNWMIKKKVLITPEGITKIKLNKKKFLSKNIDYFFTGKIINSKSNLIKILKKFDGCIIGSEKIDKEIIDNCPKLKAIVRFGVGVDNIDLEYAKKRRIIVKNVVAKSISQAVAIQCIGLILALTQNLKLHIDDSKSGKWVRHLNLFPKKTSVGVVGAGNIGQKVISYLVELGFKVNYFSRKEKPNLKKKRAKFYKRIDDMIVKSDIITLHLPHIKNQKHFFDKKRLIKMKNKYLVNLSRGTLIDEEALLKKLDDGTINFYATDVFSNEPPAKISKILLMHPKVLSTAHVGGYNQESLTEVSKIALKKINNILT